MICNRLGENSPFRAQNYFFSTSVFILPNFNYFFRRQFFSQIGISKSWTTVIPNLKVWKPFKGLSAA